MNTYGAYGAHDPDRRAGSAYTGRRLEYGTGWYLLGGRPYSAVLRRFLAPDSVSPFDAGGPNRYAYCSGDPINRIDPSGHVWTNWIRELIGRQTRVATGSGGFSAGHASEIAPPAMYTPGMVAKTVSVFRDIAMTIVGIYPSRGNPSRPGNVVFGHLAQESAASTGFSLPSNGKFNPDQFIGFPPTAVQGLNHPQDQASRKIIPQADIDPFRMKFTENGQPRVKKSWLGLQHKSNPGSTIWAADTVLCVLNFKKPLKHLAERGVTSVKLYAGMHASPHGMNWEGTGKPIMPAAWAAAVAAERITPYAAERGVNVRVINLSDWTQQQYADSLLKDGVHVIGFCFGLADSTIMEALNLGEVSLYTYPTAFPWGAP